jgi:Type IX secretion system protein PorV
VNEMKKLLTGVLIALGLVLAVAALVAEPASAQTHGGTGILKIKPGARATGMGQAGVALDQRAHSIWWNPALLARIESHDISSTMVKLVPDLADDVYYLNIGYSSVLEGWGGFAFDLMYLSYGKTEATNSEGESFGFFSSYEMVPSAGFGTRLLGPDGSSMDGIGFFGHLDVGVSVKYVLVDLAPEWAMDIVGEHKDGKADAFAVDAGILMDGVIPFGGGLWPNGMPWSFGLNFQNMGSKLVYIEADQADPLPRNLKAGIGLELYRSPGLTLTTAIDFNKSLIVYDTASYEMQTKLGWADMEQLLNMGAEISIQNRFHGRLGYVHDPEGEITSMTFGVGLDLDVSSFRFLGEGEKMVRFDYSSVPQALDLDRVSYLTVGVAF